MRLNRLLAVIIPSLAACGGGSNPPPVIIDTPPPQPDTPPQVLCEAPDLGSLTLSASMPIDAFTIPAAGQPNEGVKTFIIGAFLPAEINPSTKDALFVEATTQNPAIVTGVARTFTTDATATTYQAASYIFGNLNTTAGTIDNFLFASSGDISFSAYGETDGSTLTGTVTATGYREVDDQGADVAGGCTSTLGGLMFNLTQMDDGMPFQNDNDAHGWRLMNRDELLAAKKILDKQLGR